MQPFSTKPGTQASVEETLQACERVGFRKLAFGPSLESRFEEDTRKARSYRMWSEGLVAILGFNACLGLDYMLIRDGAWLSIVEQTTMVTPVALLANYLVWRNPAAWLRESSVAIAILTICFLNLVVEGNATANSTLFGAMCVMITALFAGVVMRLRFFYAVTSIALMLFAGLGALNSSSGLQPSAKILASSLMVIGLGIIVVASYSMEREERRNYLLCLQRDLQAEELARINTALQLLSQEDKLTGLPNRRALEERFNRMWSACINSGESLAAVVIDVDHFKRVNDVHGHLYGDQTLQRIGSLLPRALRLPDDLAARFGGEEFVLLLSHADHEAAVTVAERARQLVETAGTPLTPAASCASKMWITVSCGVSACRPADGGTWIDLVATADQALYAAKSGGRNRVEYHAFSTQTAEPLAPFADQIVIQDPHLPTSEAMSPNPLHIL